MTRQAAVHVTAQLKALTQAVRFQLSRKNVFFLLGRCLSGNSVVGLRASVFFLPGKDGPLEAHGQTQRESYCNRRGRSLSGPRPESETRKEKRERQLRQKSMCDVSLLSPRYFSFTIHSAQAPTAHSWVRCVTPMNSQSRFNKSASTLNIVVGEFSQ